MRMEEPPPVWFGYVQSSSCRIWRLVSRLKSVPFGCRLLPLSFSLPFPARAVRSDGLQRNGGKWYNVPHGKDFDRHLFV